MEQGRFVGIDVAKDRLDVHVRPHGETFATGRADTGLAESIAAPRQLDPALIVLEATGPALKPSKRKPNLEATHHPLTNQTAAQH